METVNEYRLKVSVRNNLILQAIEAHGYRSVLQFSQVNDLPYPSLVNIIGLKIPPLMTNGEFCSLAKKLMEILGAAPGDLWTDEQLTMKLQKNSSERNVGGEDFERLFNRVAQGQIEYAEPEDAVHQQEVERIISENLEMLGPRNALLLRMRFGLGGLKEHTLEEIAAHFGITRERTRQIEAHALRKLKHPNMSDALRLLVDPEYHFRRKEAERKLQKQRADEFIDRQLTVHAIDKAKRKNILQLPKEYASWVDYLKQTDPELYKTLKNYVHKVAETFIIRPH